MTSNEDKTLNINIYKENHKEIENSQNKSETYIILANEELNNKVREHLDHSAKLDEHINELENDNERMEKSITYQRGLLHNFNDIKMHQSKKIKYYEKYLNDTMNFLTTDIEKNFLYLYKIFYYDIYLSCLFLIIINYIINTNISILLLNIITILTFNMGIPYVLGFNIKHFEKIIKNYIQQNN